MVAYLVHVSRENRALRAVLRMCGHGRQLRRLVHVLSVRPTLRRVGHRTAPGGAGGYDAPGTEAGVFATHRRTGRRGSQLIQPHPAEGFHTGFDGASTLLRHPSASSLSLPRTSSGHRGAQLAWGGDRGSDGGRPSLNGSRRRRRGARRSAAEAGARRRHTTTRDRRHTVRSAAADASTSEDDTASVVTLVTASQDADP